MTTPTIHWNVDADGNWSTSADWNPHRLPNSTDDVAIDTAHLHTVTHAMGTHTVHSLAVGNDDFVVSGGYLRVLSDASFANVLSVSGGNLKFSGPATARVLSQTGGTVSGAGTFTVTGQSLFTSDCLQTGTGTTVLMGATSDFAARFCLDGERTLDNRGTFTMQGTTGILLGFNPFGVSLGGGTLTNEGIMELQGANSIGTPDAPGLASFVNAGRIEKTGPEEAAVAVDFTDTGVIDIGGGTLFFDIGASSFAGLVSGNGTLQFQGGTQALNSGASLAVGAWSVVKAAQTSVNEDLSYAGLFVLSGGSLSVAAGDTLSLGGVQNLAGGTVKGAGTVRLFSGLVQNLTVGGAVTLRDAGVVDQDGETVSTILTLAGAATLLISPDATWRIDDDSGIARGASSAASIVNNGLLLKQTATGVSRIDVATMNTGTIEAASGALQFTRMMTGGGALLADAGATLRFDASVAASLAMTFTGGGATLSLSKPSTFAATIHGFVHTDVIDLLGATATSATLGAGDTLVIKDGASVLATLQLAGNHANDTFHVASDGNGGTKITVTTAALAGGARFVAAMAGFQARGDLSAHEPLAEIRRGAHPALAAPHMQIA